MQCSADRTQHDMVAGATNPSAAAISTSSAIALAAFSGTSLMIGTPIAGTASAMALSFQCSSDLAANGKIVVKLPSWALATVNTPSAASTAISEAATDWVFTSPKASSASAVAFHINVNKALRKGDTIICVRPGFIFSSELNSANLRYIGYGGYPNPQLFRQI